MFNWPITVHVLFRSVLITNTLNSLAEERVADILARTRPPPPPLVLYPSTLLY